MKAICLATFGAVVLLAGCGPTAQEQAVMDQQRCAGFGFAPGTNAFANCMMSVTQQRDAQQAADRRAANAQAAADQRTRAAAQAAKDQADRDAWDRRTHQGAYSTSATPVSQPVAPPQPAKMKCTTTTKTVGNTTTSHQECHS